MTYSKALQPDKITILRHPTNRLAKMWLADGTVQPYDDAKYFKLLKRSLSSISELSHELSQLERDSHACVVRGSYLGDMIASEVDVEFKAGSVRRLAKLYSDMPHHWVLIEVDNYFPDFADPVNEPALAIDEFINDQLPASFHGISYHWQLSNSAGHSKHVGKLKAHVWFWLSTAYTSAQLKAWALSSWGSIDKVPFDLAVFNIVQVHYTAAPVFDTGVVNPVPVRSGFESGIAGDEVDLVINVVLDALSVEGTASSTDDLQDPFAGLEPKVGLNLSEAKTLLKYIDNENYDTWLKAGMSLHHEFDASDEALLIWDEWSATAGNYSADDLKHKWDSFGVGGQNPVTARFLIKIGKESTKNARNAEKKAALDEVKNLILDCHDTGVLINEIAKKAGLTADGDIALRTELAGLIRAQFKRITNTALSLPDVRVAMNSGRKTATRQEHGRHELTELGNVGRLIDRYGDDLMFVPQIESWYAWGGNYWQPITAVEIVQYATATVKALPDELKQITNDDDRAKHREFSIYSQCARMIDNMVKLSRSDEKVLTSIAKLDSNMDLLGCANGAVDLRTGELLAPDQTQLITYSTGVEYDQDAICPVFRQTVLDAFFGNEEMAAYFQRVIGYIALGQPKESIILIPHGSGNNGKSTIFKAIALALGDYAKTASSETFLVSGGGNGGGGAREDILRLRGARYVYSTEPDEGAELREGLIKAMTGGEAIPARGLYSRHTVEVQPTWTVVMPTNHKPIIKGDDYGIWRRILLIPFTRNYDTDDSIAKDLDRPTKLLREMPGILRWVVDGALQYRKHGLGHPDSVKAAKDEYKSEMDLLRDWIEACCIEAPDQSASNDALFASWEAYSRAKGEMKLIPTQRHLTRRISSKGYRKIKDALGVRGRGFAGIGVVLGSDFCDISDKEIEK